MEPLWVKDPRVLIDEWENLWPFDKELTTAEQANAATRMVALASLGASVYTKNPRYLSYGLGGLAVILAWYQMNKPLESKIDDDATAATPLQTQPQKLAQIPPFATVAPPTVGYPQPPFHEQHPHQYYTYPWPNPLVGYNDLGNEQTTFGFNNAADPSDTVNRYTLDAASNKARYEMRYKQGVDYPSVSEANPGDFVAGGPVTKRDAAIQVTQLTEDPYSLTEAEKMVTQRSGSMLRGPNRQDARSESFSGIIPRWDALAAMQMDPHETTYEHQGGYEPRSYGTDDVLPANQGWPSADQAAQGSDATAHYDDTAHRAGVGEFEAMGARDNPLVTGDNPYGNPHIYQGHEAGQMRRLQQPDEVDVYRMARDHAQRDSVKMYYGAGEMDEGLFINPLPDPSLQARPVFFPESSEWDRHIVGTGNIRGGSTL